MNSLKCVIVAFCLILLSSCQQDLFDPNFFEENYFVENVPESFDWSTVRTVGLTVLPDDKHNGSYYYQISVYDKNPLSDSTAVCLTQGVAKRGEPLRTSVVAPEMADRLFVSQTSPSGSQIISDVALTASHVVCDFAPVAPEDVVSPEAVSFASMSRAVEVDFTVPGNAIRVPVTASSFKLQRDKSYLIDQDFRGELLFPSGGDVKIYVSARLTWSASHFALRMNSQFYLLSGGEMQFARDTETSLDQSAMIAIQEGGVFGRKDQDMDIRLFTNSIFYIAGELFAETLSMNHSSSIEIASTAQVELEKAELTQGVFKNASRLNVEELKLDLTKVYNTGDIICETLESTQSRIENVGYLLVHDDAKFIRTSLINQCLVEMEELSMVGGDIRLGMGTKLRAEELDLEGVLVAMDESSMLHCEEIDFVGRTSTLQGIGAEYALIRAEELGFDVWKAARFRRNLEIQYEEIDSEHGANGYSADSSVRWTKTPYVKIESNDCNGGGTPGDTIPPVDPQFPIIIENNSKYTFIMEDNYPKMGDYDLNDLVVRLLSQKLTKEESGLISSIRYEMKLIAAGSTRETAFALQLPADLSSKVGSVDIKGSNSNPDVFDLQGGSFERAGQEIVIPVIGEAHGLFGVAVDRIVNCNPKGLIKAHKRISFEIKFSTPVDESDLLISKMNFFTITGKNANGKRQETHLPGFKHSSRSKIDPKVVASTSNLMWAMFVPSDFAYPIETISIKRAYPQFEKWIQSGKTKYQDWYLHPANGNQVMK